MDIDNEKNRREAANILGVKKFIYFWGQKTHADHNQWLNLRKRKNRGRPQKSRNGNAHDWIYSETGCIQFLIEMGSEDIQPMDQDVIDNMLENFFLIPA